MNIDKLGQIKAIGNLLDYYRSDLIYIHNFQRFKCGEILLEEYRSKEVPGSFRRFLNEFRVARNVKREKVDDFLDFTEKWVRNSPWNDVDAFADELQKSGITHDGKTMTSLASKVLFLNNPQVILPCDTRNRAAIGETENRYKNFLEKIEDILEKETAWINAALEPVQVYLRTIEREFDEKIADLETIRRNRYLDKLLWVAGQRGEVIRT